MPNLTMGMNPITYTLALLLALGIGVGYWWLFMRHKKHKKGVVEAELTTTPSPTIPVVPVAVEVAPRRRRGRPPSNPVAPAPEPPRHPVEYATISPTGEYRAIAVYQNNTADGVRINNPVGHPFAIDASMPGGGVYSASLIKELKDGSMVAWSPLNVPIDIKNTPQRAWIAINIWKRIVPQFWCGIATPWQKLSKWLIWIYVGITVIVLLMSIGG